MARAFVLVVHRSDGVTLESGRWGDTTMTDEQLESYREVVVERARQLTKIMGNHVRIYSPGENDDPYTEDDLYWDSTVNK